LNIALTIDHQESVVTGHVRIPRIAFSSLALRMNHDQ